ncbi:MAG: hypothetical protein ACJ8BC_00045 [Gemmatimonadales bacterium]
MPIPTENTELKPRQEVEIWRGSQATTLHGVQVRSDSLTGVPLWRPPDCDSCRVVMPLGDIDSLRTVSTERSWMLLAGVPFVALGGGGYLGFNRGRLKYGGTDVLFHFGAGGCCREAGPIASPGGTRAAALVDTSFTWIERQAPGFRVYFLADSYPAAHQDSLLALLPKALAGARELIQAPALAGPVDLFFIESRSEMRALTGVGATGFAQPSARAVFLVTNPEWRAFERHEIMHVVAGQTWGSTGPDSDWLQEGLAQAADGACAGYSNSEVALALAQRHGWIPLSSVIGAFRQQPDVRAYLQAAAL